MFMLLLSLNLSENDVDCITGDSRVGPKIESQKTLKYRNPEIIVCSN